MLPTVVVAHNTVDAVCGSVVMARERKNLFDLRFIEDDQLTPFFTREAQQALPNQYQLVLLDIVPRRRSLTGELTRPRLMDALRGFAKPVRWLSRRPWDAENMAAVQHVIGERNVRIEPSSDSCTELVLDTVDSEDRLGRQLAEALRNGSDAADWVPAWLRTLDGLRMLPDELIATTELLIKGEPELLDEETRARAHAILAENARLAGEESESSRIDGVRLAHLKVPAGRFCFRGELGALVREKAEAQVSVVAFPEKRLAFLAADPEQRESLAELARYPTDTLPGCDLEQDTEDRYALILSGSRRFDSAFEELLTTLRDGSFLLRT